MFDMNSFGDNCPTNYQLICDFLNRLNPEDYCNGTDTGTDAIWDAFCNGDFDIDLWNHLCDETNTHERDYYKMSELEEVLRGVEDDILSEDFDESMPYFTQDINGKLISVDYLLDVYKEELYK